MGDFKRSFLFLAIFCMVITMLAFYHTHLLYIAEVKKAQTRIVNTTYLLSEWVKTGFNASDYVLRDIIYTVPSSSLTYPAIDKKQHQDISELIINKQKTIPYSNGVGLADKKCIVTHTPSIVGFNASQREWCRTLMEDVKLDTYVSNLFLSNTGELMVIQGRVFPGDEFNGVAAIGINLQFFSKLLNQISGAPHRVLAIVDENLNLLARKPEKPQALGKVIDDPTIYDFIASKDSFKIHSYTSPLDGEFRMYGLRKIDNLPFIIVAGEANRDWEANLNRKNWLIYIAVFIVWVMAFFILKNQWGRLDNLNKLKQAKNDLEKLSQTDPLTGLANRRHFDTVLSDEFQRMHRNHTPLSILMLDIDHFKDWNDTYGHQQGDECLKIVADTIRGTLKRSQDLVARYGGEEFSCILPDTKLQDAANIASQIRENIEFVDIIVSGNAQPLQNITISIGVATIEHYEDCTQDQLIKMADDQLYWAKENGRNCVGCKNAHIN